MINLYQKPLEKLCFYWTIKSSNKNIFFDTCSILDSSPDSFEQIKLPSAPSVSQTYSNVIETGSNVKSWSKSENFFSPLEKIKTLTVQKPPLSTMPVAPAITPAITPRPIDPSDIDPPPCPFSPPLLSKIVARKSKSFEHHATFCDKPTTSVLQKIIHETSASGNPPDLKFASALSCEIFSLLNPKLASSLYSTSPIDDFLNCESQNSSNITLTFSPQMNCHSYTLRSRPI